MITPARQALAALLLMPCAVTAVADVVLTEGTNISVDASADGRLAMDLLGELWIVPRAGGDAERVTSGPRPAGAPRWSPDSGRLVYEYSDGGQGRLWLHDLDSPDESRSVGPDEASLRDPAWHPGGEKLVFAAAEDGTGFDLREVDLATGLSWRLTMKPGNETAPAWSADGRDLVYVHEHDDRWHIVLRRRGEAEEVLVESDKPLASPAWRPDGSLVTYLTFDGIAWRVRMTILSEPRLDRVLMDGEDYFLAPVSWVDRQHLVYTADGKLRRRNFDDWDAADIPFRASLSDGWQAAAVDRSMRELPVADTPSGRRIVRAKRLFDGTGDGYRQDVDVVIDDGRITSIERSRKRDGEIVIDLGDVTVMPGYIDAYARLPGTVAPSLGPLLLAMGVTTLIADHPRAAELDRLWTGQEMPGPRILRAVPIEAAASLESVPWLVTVTGGRERGAAVADEVRRWQSQGVAVLADSWQTGLAAGTSLLLGSGPRPTSPAGRRYQDMQMATGNGRATFISGLADRNTPGLEDIRESRPAKLLPPTGEGRGRAVAGADLTAAATSTVVGSRPNGLPPGIGLHAELRALVAAGLSPVAALKAAGVNAAATLGLGIRIGRVAPGAAADLVLVAGDPLAAIEDTLNVVAVVRNGRFYSVSGLLDRIDDDTTVE